MTDAPQQPAPEPPPAAAPQQPAVAPPPAKPDYTMAWLPHLLLIFTWWLGPLIIWLVKKEESKLAAFHGKQALIFGVAATILSSVTAITCVGPFVVGGVVTVFGVIAMVKTSKGEPYKYPFVADKFCAAEFAAAYPEAAAQQAQAAPQPQEPQEPEQPEQPEQPPEQPQA